jgi:glycosyltransferase involved in cell wall biosynthesis
MSIGGEQPSNQKRILVFGVFYPDHAFAGNSTTGIVFGLSQSDIISRVVLVAQTSSQVPPALGAFTKLELHRVWKVNDAASLVRAGLILTRFARKTDSVLFNIFPTSFGRSRLCSAFGLLLPTIVRIAARRPVTTFMHSLVETQDLAQMGYEPSLLARVVASLLERALINTTRVVVPLPSQVSIIQKEFRKGVSQVFLPYVESLVSGAIALHSGKPIPVNQSSAPSKILLFGNWSPQKDLSGTLEVLSSILANRPDVQVTVAGSVNPNFPEYASTVSELRARYESNQVNFIGRVSEESTVPLILGHDLMVLPYLATGGYSGALNCGAFCGIRIVAYDQPQLRESAKLLNYPVEFIPPRDYLQLKSAIERGLREPVSPDRADTVRRNLSIGFSAIGSLALFLNWQNHSVGDA